MNVLLLNASFEPLAVVKLSRAIGLLMDGKVEVIESMPGRELRSAHLRQPMPSVLRLRYYVIVPRRGIGWSRRGVLARDHHTCQYCGKKMHSHDETVDHVTPQWQCRAQKIPPNTWSNTVASWAVLFSLARPTKKPDTTFIGRSDGSNQNNSQICTAAGV